MKIVDRYLIKQFLQTVLFGLLAFTLIFVIIDLMENMDDFIDQDVPNNMILFYYFVFIPEIIKLMMPVAVLLACLFTVGKMVNQNEFTALKSAGISLYRFMLPFIIASIFISIFSIYFGGYVVPYANKEKILIEQKHMRKGLVNAGSNIFFQDSKTRIVTIAYYDVTNLLANRISIQSFNPDDLTEMIERIDASRMKYDTLTSEWIAYNGVKRTFEKKYENAEKFSEYKIDNLNFTPDDVIQKQRKPEELTITELQAYAKDQLRTGNDPTRVLIEYHSRISFAFASFVVVLFGLPIGANKRGRNLALQFGLNLLITFIYLVFMKISQAFGKNGVMEPMLTAWFANIIFFGAAIFNLLRVQK
ncbi:MAG: LptF/LptG family permease [Melioribacteraceae bacterium]|nr:LptF/LptG family permease [Melioribacteraceae bacterium]MCF8353064.1 LptF/LptG family permease [Melioribacteraceae bacterium]MCF8392790.1 LptF/LptG family permease [Melioribacteraceae bacterium]MCF8418321.1 LptF/LptG family permease [Melioribacteraceae bacterium]